MLLVCHYTCFGPLQQVTFPSSMGRFFNEKLNEKRKELKQNECLIQFENKEITIFVKKMCAYCGLNFTDRKYAILLIYGFTVNL